MTSDKTTREKILNVSHRLFSLKGVDAVSIREIAKECDVNVAAVNYYFQNKDNLFRETVILSLQRIQLGIGKIYEKTENTNVLDISLAIFDYLVESSEDLRTSFKLVISNTKNHLIFQDENFSYNGPPGGEVLHKVFEENYPQASQEDIEWCVRTIFTQIIHKALIMGNESICKSICSKGLPTDILRQDIMKLVHMVSHSLK